MLACTLKLDGHDYQLKAGDRITTTEHVASSTTTFIIEFRTAEGLPLEVVHSEGAMKAFGINCNDRTVLLSLVSMLTGLKVSDAVTSGDKRTYELLAK